MVRGWPGRLRVSPWLARPLLGAIAAIAALGAGVARADAPVPAEQPKPADSPYLLSGDRFLEVNVSLTQQIDWNGLAGVVGPLAYTGLVAGAEIGVPFDSQRVRPALFSGLKVGAWGDATHGPVGAVEGARFRWSPVMWDVFDVYLVGRADLDLQPDVSTVFRPGAGVGLRAARLAAVEVTWDVSVPLGATFAGTRHPDLVPFGVSFGLLFDACFACNRNAKPQTHRDLACRLYHAAASKPPDSEICAAIPTALSALLTADASRDDDGTLAFLTKLSTLVRGPNATSVVRGLLALHDSLLRDWAEYEQRTAHAAQRDRLLDEVWTYAPVPIEVRAFLGCDRSDDPQKPFPAPTCSEVTE